MDDLISKQEAIDALERIFDRCEEIEAHLPEGDPDRTGYKMYPDWLKVWKYLCQGSSAQPEPTLERIEKYCYKRCLSIMDNALLYKYAQAEIQPEIIHCKDCEYGVTDEYGRWYCRSVGYQIGDDDGNGFCADAERRTYD